ncbi:MAG: ATP-binding protein [bacterium]|nr:ATP-binding protein [bacterium]
MGRKDRFIDVTMAECHPTREDLLQEIDSLKEQVEELVSHKGKLLKRVEELERMGDTRGKTDQEIIRLERLHALEEMAQRVAHNFNNILVGMLGYAQIIEMQSEDPNAVRHAKKIVESSLRAKDLVKRLNLSVRQVGEMPSYRVTSLNTIVQEAVRATRPQWQGEAGKKGILIEIVQDLDAVPPIRSSPVELHHVLVHLISNAADAMRKGGEILITTRLWGNLVTVAVKDQGVGMDAEVQKRIFEPFFTTKQDVGSGLGLSMAYRTVMGWNGRIEVESEPGQGSTFTVFLPVWQEEAQIEASNCDRKI